MGEMTKKPTVPAIRFKGFTDTWEQRKLGEALSFLKDGTHGTHQDSDVGVYLLSAKNIKNGEIVIDKTADRKISEEEFEVIHSTFKLQKKDVLLTIVGSIGEVAILQTPDIMTFQRSVAFLRPKEWLIPSFLKTEIESDIFQKELSDRKSQSAQPGIYLGELEKIPFVFPVIEEQQVISSYFRNLDRLITLHQRKLDKLHKVKRSLLESMFPRNGANVPEIRFSGFTDAWEQRKLSDMVDRVTRKNENLESELPLTISAQYGLIDQNEFFDKRIASRDVSGYYLLKKGEFAYNKSTSSDAPWGAVKRLDRYEMGVLSTLYIVFALKENGNIDSDFLVSYYDTDCWHKGVQAIAAEGARNHGLLNITPADYFETVLTVPSDVKEQHQIGTFFAKLDSLITLHQRKLDKLHKVKRSLLESMFPRNGANVPEIRFSGFTDAWEQRKLSDMVDRVTRKNENLESELPLTISAQYGLIDQNEFFDKRIASRDVSGYYLLKKGEFAYNKSTSSDAPWGAVKRLDRYEMGVPFGERLFACPVIVNILRAKNDRVKNFSAINDLKTLCRCNKI